MSNNIDQTQITQAIALGAFYVAAMKYAANYRRGGCQKLQRLIGESLFFKVGAEWVWNNPKISRMSAAELETLTRKIQ